MRLDDAGDVDLLNELLVREACFVEGLVGDLPGQEVLRETGLEESLGLHWTHTRAPCVAVYGVPHEDLHPEPHFGWLRKHWEDTLLGMQGIVVFPGDLQEVLVSRDDDLATWDDLSIGHQDAQDIVGLQMGLRVGLVVLLDPGLQGLQNQGWLGLSVALVGRQDVVPEVGPRRTREAHHLLVVSLPSDPVDDPAHEALEGPYGLLKVRMIGVDVVVPGDAGLDCRGSPEGYPVCVN